MKPETAAPLPRLLRIRQQFDVPPPVDIRRVLPAELAPFRALLKPKARIGVAVGSRGITRLAEVVGGVLEFLRAADTRPFLIPAMGSHGGATPAGQRAILADYGLTEDTVGAPIHDAMAVVPVGTTEENLTVHWSVEAMQADGVILINRIKPHTDFDSNTLGSGLLKMLVVGLGKHQGAAHYHGAVTQFGYERITRSAARLILNAAPILFGVGIVENQVHEPTRIAAIAAADLEQRESELFAQAKRLMPRLPFAEIDLLIVDRLGKNISGTGMDPGIIGREIHGYSTAASELPSRRPRVRRLFVRDLTPETHGNALGIGMADFTTSRLVRAIDLAKSYQNVLTSLSLNGIKIPIHFETDREVLEHALASLRPRPCAQIRIVRIPDTLSVTRLDASENCMDMGNAQAHLEILGPPEELRYDPDGNLPPFAIQ